METCRHFYVTLVLLLIPTVHGASIQVTPGSITLGSTTSLTLNCTADISKGSISKIFSIQIQKKLNSGFSLLAGIDLGGLPELKNTSLTQRATVTGNVGTGSNVVSGSYLQLVLTNVVCEHSGQFRCTISGKNGGGTNINHEDSANVTALPKPESITMYSDPDSKTYSVNQNVSIRCTGKLGNPAKGWVWQWKSKSAPSWTLYPYTNQTKDEDPEGCENNGATVLSYVVRLEDNGRIIRCSVEGNEKYSSSKTIYVTGLEPTTPKAGGSTSPVAGKSEKARSGNIVMMIGITIGLVLNKF